MIADAAKLTCKICVPLYCQIQATKYGITNCCDALDPKASIYLWLTKSGCTLTRGMSCEIEDYLSRETYTPPTTTESTTCGINVADTSAGLTSCSQSPTINILL